MLGCCFLQMIAEPERLKRSLCINRLMSRIKVLEFKERCTDGLLRAFVNIRTQRYSKENTQRETFHCASLLQTTKKVRLENYSLP